MKQPRNTFKYRGMWSFVRLILHFAWVSALYSTNTFLYFWESWTP